MHSTTMTSDVEPKLLQACGHICICLHITPERLHKPCLIQVQGTVAAGPQGHWIILVHWVIRSFIFGPSGAKNFYMLGRWVIRSLIFRPSGAIFFIFRPLGHKIFDF